MLNFLIATALLDCLVKVLGKREKEKAIEKRLFLYHKNHLQILR